MTRHLKWALASSCIGSLFPVGYLVLYYAGFIRSFPNWGAYLWPTSLMLLATDGQEGHYLFVAEVVAFSLLTNVVIWFVGGLIASACVGRLVPSIARESK